MVSDFILIGYWIDFLHYHQMSMRSQYDAIVRLIYYNSLVDAFLQTSQISKVHLMFLQFLKDFDVAGTYSWDSACLTWLYRELCRASHIDACDISSPLIILQLWI